MEELLPHDRPGNVFLRLHPVHRILIGLLVSFCSYFLMKDLRFHPLLLMLYLWNIFALVVLTISWVVFCTRTVGQIRQFARREDSSLVYVFLLIIMASFTCLFALLLVFIQRDRMTVSAFLYLLAALPAMVLSWLMIQTTFAFHYAHIYYDDMEEDRSRHAEGLHFPNEKKPDYLDFAYFSFVIGMTFQVSDVSIQSRKIRRLALLHGFMAFTFNTFIVALTINLIASLKI